MKKLYLLMACAALTLGAQAANLKFMMGDREIAPGSTVKFTDYTAEEYEPGVWDIYMNPGLAVVSDFFTNTVTVTATCTSGQAIQMCCGGQCVKGETVKKENLTIQTNQVFDLDFEFIDQEYEGPSVPVITTTISAVDGDGEPVEFTLVMGPDDTALDAVESSSYVRPAEGGIAYSLTSAATLSLYNPAGTPVLTAECEGNGTVSTTGIAPGLYIYALGNKTGKIVIK